MPVISRFLGIVISMYWNDHAPPHFHAAYAEFEITVEIASGPRDGMNPELAKVGASYGVIKFYGGAVDRPHWSTNGK